MYPRIPRELVAHPLGSAEHTLETTALLCLATGITSEDLKFSWTFDIVWTVYHFAIYM